MFRSGRDSHLDATVRERLTLSYLFIFQHLPYLDANLLQGSKEEHGHYCPTRQKSTACRAPRGRARGLKLPKQV